MSGKCRPSLRPKTLYNVDRSSLSTTDKECIHAVFELADHQKSEIEKNEKIIKAANDLIETQKAEIERLKEQVNLWQEEAGSVGCANEWLKASLKNAKAEAIKEFAKEIRAEIDKAIKSNQQAKKQRIDRLNEKGIVYIDNVCSCCDGKIHALCGIGEFIDNLVKEMVGESDV